MYFVITVQRWPRRHEDWIIEKSFDNGATGVAEKLNFSQKDYESSAEERTTDPYDLEIYFSEKPTEVFLSTLKEFCSDADIEVRQEQDKDWLEEWKKGYEPFEICDGVHIVPRWRTQPPEAKQVILLEPGMAFGTGTHETTQLAAKLVQEVCSKQKIATALDVGTGTGILAMVASRLNVRTITALDLEPEARRVCRENLDINKISNITVIDEQLPQLNQQYQLVIANIVDHVLLKVHPSLIGAVKPAGFLVISGILLENLAEFLRDFNLPPQWQWTRTLRGKEWAALMAQRTP